MKEQCIEFTENKQTETYLIQIFEKSGIPYVYQTEYGRTAFKFAASDRTKDSLICGIILNFYKLRELMKGLKTDAQGRAFYALLGALIGLEHEEETEKIMELLEGKSVTNVDGFYNFCLNGLRESWENLSKLSAKLYAQCRGEEDVYALSVFMLGMDESVSATVVINSGEELYWEKNGIKIAVVPYFGERERDMIVTLLSQRPSDVVVVDPSGVSEGLLSVIRSLGE